MRSVIRSAFWVAVLVVVVLTALTKGLGGLFEYIKLVLNGLLCVLLIAAIPLSLILLGLGIGVLGDIIKFLLFIDD